MKFIIDNIFLIGLAILSGGALLLPYLQQRGNSLTSLQATQMINQGKTLVLDVRDDAAYGAGHLREAKHIPVKDLATRAVEIEKFKNRNVIVVCQSGTQSARAAAQLKKAGFENVFGLSGGVAAWQAQGLPTVSSVPAAIKELKS